MPTVPVYNQQQVQESALRPAMAQNTDVSSGFKAVGQTLDNIGQQAVHTEAFDAQAKITEDFLKWSTEEQKKSQGSNAAGYAAKVEKWWDDQRTAYGASLSPMAQNLIGKQLQQSRLAAMEQAAGFEKQQIDIGERSALTAAVSALTNQAVAAGPDKATVYLDQAAEQMRAYAKSKGIDATPEILRATTGAHTTIIGQLMQRDPKAAEQYFNTHKDQIDSSQWDNIGAKLNAANAVNDGSTKADEIWAAFMGKATYNSPVDQFAMEKQAREAFPNDPTRAAAAVNALRERRQAWDASQNEFNAGNTNTVWGMVDKRIPLSQIQKTPEWQALPQHEQHQIRRQLVGEAMQDEGRALQAEQREILRIERNDKLMLLHNADQYLEYTDPTKLQQMSRPQVEALRSKFGFNAAQQLLERYDALRKSPADLTEAKMDEDSFKRIASDFQLNAYTPKTQEEKQQLGDLKFRVERLIATAQLKKGGKLTEDEKDTLMRDEMTRTVTVNPGWYAPNKQVPVIQLTGEQAQRVVVPAADRSKIVDALQTMYRRTNDPQYAPTEENVRALYLRRSSASSPLIPPAKR